MAMMCNVKSHVYLLWLVRSERTFMYYLLLYEMCFSEEKDYDGIAPIPTNFLMRDVSIF